MTTSRLYTFFSLIVVLALVTAGVMALPMLAGLLNRPASVTAVSAEEARLIQRRGEWAAGAAVDAETARFVAYSNSLAEDARLIQRRGEWAAGAAASDAEIARFVAYSNSLAEDARLIQRRGEWAAGANSPAAMDVENARLAWRANH